MDGPLTTSCYSNNFVFFKKFTDLWLSLLEIEHSGRVDVS